jgi:hypothetical protein
MQDLESVHPGLQQYNLNLSPNKNPVAHRLIIRFMQILLYEIFKKLALNTKLTEEK